MFLLFVAFFLGEGPLSLSRLTAAERMQALGMAILFVGLPLAWKWEGLGGLLSVAGFGLLAILSATNLHTWILRVPAIIGAVHVASWGRLRTEAPANLVPWHLPRVVTLSFLAVLVAFLLLCANEIFGQPPLMTPTLHPDSSLVRDWHGTGVDLSVHPDASITGTIGGIAITEGRIVYGRSRFGRLLHMNSPYRITGKISGARFSAPLDYTGDALDGSLFLQNRPTYLKLVSSPR